MGSRVFVATESGTVNIKGEGDLVFVKNVTRVREGHPLLKKVPMYFRPVEEEVHYDYETATAEPKAADGRRGVGGKFLPKKQEKAPEPEPAPAPVEPEPEPPVEPETEPEA